MSGNELVPVFSGEAVRIIDMAQACLVSQQETTHCRVQLASTARGYQIVPGNLEDILKNEAFSHWQRMADPYSRAFAYNPRMVSVISTRPEPRSIHDPRPRERWVNLTFREGSTISSTETLEAVANRIKHVAGEHAFFDVVTTGHERVLIAKSAVVEIGKYIPFPGVECSYMEVMGVNDKGSGSVPSYYIDAPYDDLLRESELPVPVVAR